MQNIILSIVAQQFLRQCTMSKAAVPKSDGAHFQVSESVCPMERGEEEMTRVEQVKGSEKIECECLVLL